MGADVRIAFDECWLEGHGRCEWPLDRHHFIAKGQTQGNGRARKESEGLVVPVCRRHNATTKAADSKWARRLIAERLVEELGRPEVERRLALAWKVARPELTLGAILAGPPPPLRW